MVVANDPQNGDDIHLGFVKGEYGFINFRAMAFLPEAESHKIRDRYTAFIRKTGMNAIAPPMPLPDLTSWLTIPAREPVHLIVDAEHTVAAVYDGGIGQWVRAV